MKILKIIGIIVLIVMVLTLGLVIFGPSSGHVERQIVIDAPPEVVYAEVSNLKTFNKWSPWFQLDPDAEYKWEGPPTGVGAKQIWYSDDENVGNGYMEITEVREGEFIGMDMAFDQNGNRDFTDEGEEKPYASFILEPEGDGTKVTWTFDISGVSGLEKIMVVALDKFLGPQYEKGLQALKERVEGRPTYNVDIQVMEVAPITYAGKEVSSSHDPDEIGQVMGAAYSEIMAALTQAGVSMEDGSPLAVIMSYSDDNMSMVCGIPVAEGTQLDDEGLSIGQSPGGTVVRALHFGDYKKLVNTHEQIDQYADYYGYELEDKPWEIYVTNPDSEPDTTKWITEVYYLIR